MWFLALFWVVSSGVLLALSVVPRMLEQVPDRPAWIVAGVFALFAGLSAVWHLVRTPRADRPRRRLSPLIVLVALVLTPILLTPLAPRRLVFNRYQPQFETLLGNAPPPGDRSTANLNADLGLFWIDQWGTDARGGTYFRTMIGAAPEDRSFG